MRGEWKVVTLKKLLIMKTGREKYEKARIASYDFTSLMGFTLLELLALVIDHSNMS